MSEKNGIANAARRLALLWGSQTVAGRSGLTVKAIVTVAMAIADDNGLEGLSMRHVAERLGVGTMSLYTHIPGKTELIDLMLDTTYSELYETVEQPSQQSDDWREAMRYIAQQNWTLYRRHTWMLDVATARPALGPHAARKYEAELRPLDQLGLTDVEMDGVLTLILSHVEGCARQQAQVDRTQRESGMTDAEWWVTQEPLLDKWVNPALFPIATRVGVSAGQTHQAASNPEYNLAFGLELILAGVSELIQSRSKG